MRKSMLIVLFAAAFSSCSDKDAWDAAGNFEATEVVVSAEQSGRILSLDVEEGDTVAAGKKAGVIDTVQLSLQRLQLEKQQEALLSSRPDVQKQVSSLREQISKQERERERTTNLLRDGAATQKQLDDIEAQLNMLKKQLDAQLSALGKNVSTIEGNAASVELQIEQVKDRLRKCIITSPIQGQVLAKYSEAGELASAGRPLFKVADLNKIFMRAYFTSDQLSKIQIGQEVKVFADFGGGERIEYPGKITWISSDSEFTPKNIQTKNSRANLVYAAKIAVKNDGKLKIGLYGEVKL